MAGRVGCHPCIHTRRIVFSGGFALAPWLPICASHLFFPFLCRCRLGAVNEHTSVSWGGIWALVFSPEQSAVCLQPLAFLSQSQRRFSGSGLWCWGPRWADPVRCWVKWSERESNISERWGSVRERADGLVGVFYLFSALSW